MHCRRINCRGNLWYFCSLRYKCGCSAPSVFLCGQYAVSFLSYLFKLFQPPPALGSLLRSLLHQQMTSSLCGKTRDHWGTDFYQLSGPLPNYLQVCLPSNSSCSFSNCKKEPYLLFKAYFSRVSLSSFCLPLRSRAISHPLPSSLPVHLLIFLQEKTALLQPMLFLIYLCMFLLVGKLLPGMMLPRLSLNPQCAAI